ncbi:MAG: LysR family transcriptional regulator [Proteobacteria bacterium]|nr:LysR family transcriptional regulator [Pseudomonadota bacterium]
MRINFELLDLRAFLAVLDLGGFHRAAAALNLSQSALSRRIRALEDAVGAPLLERTTRHVAPTATGRAFEPLARRSIEDIESQLMILTGAGERLEGQITVACIPTAAFYFLPRAIERFNKHFPRIRFRILDLSANEALDSVARGQAEFGINLTGSTHEELTFTPLIDDPFVLACRRDHAIARRKRLSWSDLEDEPLIGVSRTSGNRGILDQALSKAGVHLSFRYEVNHLTTSLGLVERGLGVSVLPRLATPPAGHPTIVTKPIGTPEVRRTIGLTERRRGRLSPAAQRFRDLLLAIGPAGPGK